MQCLVNLTIAVENTEIDDNATEKFGQNIYDDEKTSQLEVVHFNFDTFFKFICNDVSKETVGKMLELMRESISDSFSKNKREYYKLAKS